MRMWKGIHHVALKAAGEAQFHAAVAFYAQTLDCPVVRQWGEGAAQGAMLDIGNVLLEITANGGRQAERGRFAHIAFHTDNVDEAVERARGAGCTVFVEPSDKSLGPDYFIRIAFCIGPVGEEIEFFQER